MLTVSRLLAPEKRFALLSCPSHRKGKTMHMRNLIAAAGAALMLTACATPTTGRRMIDAGPRPTDAQASAAIKNYLQRALRDPDSLKQFKILSGPTLVTWYRGLLNGGGNEQAWLYCFEYNAKNAYGGYVGLKTDGFALRGYIDSVGVVPEVNWALADRNCF